VLSFDPPVPPLVDLGVDLLVEVAHRPRAHPRAPQRLGDVLHPAHRNPGEIHLDQRFLDAAFPPLVALDDRRLKGLAPELRHLELHRAGLGVERPLVAARPRVFAPFAALVSSRTAQAVGFSVQHRVQGFLDRPAHHLAKVVSYPRLVDLDYPSHRLWSVVLVHSQLLSASLKGADLAIKCAKDLVRYPRL